LSAGDWRGYEKEGTHERRGKTTAPRLPRVQSEMALNMAVKNGTPLLMKRIVSHVPVAVLCLAIAGFFLGCSKTGIGPVSRDKITIALAATTDSVLAQVALAKGFYAQEGLEVIAKTYPYGKVALQEMTTGKADIATVAETPVMLAIMKGEPLSILATIQTSNVDNAVIATKKAGIRAPRDLKRKRIAVTSGTTSDYFLDAFLVVNGIGRKDVVIVDAKAENTATMLARGKVDAISVFIPFSLQAQKELGDQVVTFTDPNIYTFTFNTVATQDFVSKNPEKVKKVLRALVRAEDFVRKNPMEAQNIAADFAKIDVTRVRDVWPVTNFEVSLDQSLLLALEDESRWAIKDGLTSATTIHNYLDHIYLDGLKAVKPKAVRILR
jgi:sulfonate transport system substrate-binding protein